MSMSFKCNFVGLGELSVWFLSLLVIDEGFQPVATGCCLRNRPRFIINSPDFKYYM